MKRRDFVSAAAAGTALASVPKGAALAQAPAVVWNLPHVAAPSYYLITNLTIFAAKVKEKSGGRMEIRVHPASSLYPGPELIPAVLDGRADIAPIVSPYLTDVLLETGVLELPFMTQSHDEHRKAQEALRPFINEMTAKRGLKMLAAYAWPSQQLFSAQPVRTIADWKGRKLRVTGAETSDFVRAVGGAPVGMAFGEVYTSLQRGVIDGAITSATNAEPMKFFEVSKYLNYWNLAGAANELLVVNLRAWEKLPPDLQKVVTDSVAEVRLEEKQWSDMRALDATTRERVVALGMTVVDPAPAEIAKARQAARGGWDLWLKRTGDNGKRAMEIALKSLGR
jgi:TRAP-type C4-dicarboxylate transport system substrate-binding protein